MTEPDNSARWQSAFGHDATRGHREELVKLGGRAFRVLFLEGLKDLVPTKATAIDDTVCPLELSYFLVGDPRSPQSDGVEPNDMAAQSVQRDKWWHVFVDMCLAANHRKGPDTTELVNSGCARKIGAIPNCHMAGKHRIVGKNRVVSDSAVMGHVSVDHEEVVVADDGLAIFFHGEMKGDILADCVSGSDHKSTGFLGYVDVLGQASEDSPLTDRVLRSQCGAVLDDHMSGNLAAIANDDICFDHAHGPYPNVVTDNSRWVHNG